ncbi:MAG: TonB family protein [Candidatus Krumholzibacteriota bacterium]|nr:TonB family protein [Candidatus Krumholzibacteriota bacterium]
MGAKDPLHIPWAFSLSEAPRLPATGEGHPLRREAARWLAWSTAGILALGLLAFGVWWLWWLRHPPSPPPREIRIVRYTDLGVPPSIAEPAAPQLNIAQAVAEAAPPPAIAVPEPVPDEQAQRRTIATMAEMTEALAPITMEDLGAGGGDSLVVDIDIDTRPAPGEFVAVEQEPVRIAIDPPVYPGVAMAAGVEGTVIVRVLVGRDGKVADALVVDGIPMLDEAALACARTAVFRPALLQNRPIEVWVLMPIVFKLH